MTADILSEEELLEFRAAFLHFDTDGSGSICAEELGCVLKEFGQVRRGPHI